jgi:tetratricopeptide (TPR) repeat protein
MKCPECGAEISRFPKDRYLLIAWLGAGLVLIIALLVLAQGDSGPGQVVSPPVIPEANNPAVSSLIAPTTNPRDAADQLFNQVMTAASSGQPEEAARLLPSAISAYEQGRPLDADGMFHLGLLYQTAEDNTRALATATEVLATQPNHLLNLSVAAEAALMLGDIVTSQVYYQRLLDAYEGEIARGLLEYGSHGDMLETLRTEARRALGGN